MSEKLDIYELKMTLFDNSKLEEFLLFVQNLQMTLEVSGMFAASAKIQYLRTLLRGKELLQLDMLSIQLASKTIASLTALFWV